MMETREARLMQPKTPYRFSLPGYVRRRVLGLLERIEEGRLTVIEEDGSHTFGRTAEDLSATVRIVDKRFYLYVAFRGTIGAAESYMRGHWSCDDLTAVIRLIARNRHLLASIEGGAGRLFSPIFRLYHWMRRNTVRGTRNNIAEHYDLGNTFFAEFLDQTMMYSSAYFPAPEATLHEASLAKMKRICEKLELKAEDHLLEIGTGWGGLAIYAASEYGCRVTTTTVSKKQFRFVEEKVKEEGLAEQITLLQKDYRDLSGQYDKLVSVEMIEAVGYEFLGLYFRRCEELLRPGGRMFLQAITIADEFYEEARRSVDFIKRYIFPGSELPSLNGIHSTVQAETSLEISEIDEISVHYAQTLRLWRERFFANLERIKALGLSESFIRMWHFYFCYCEAGFREGRIQDFQITLTRRECP